MRRVFGLLLAAAVAMVTPTAAFALGDITPTAVITAPATINPGATLHLSGAGSFDDSSITSYRWKIDAGSTWSTSSPAIDVDGLAIGRHTVTLVVVDDTAHTSEPATAQVIVVDTVAPTAVLDAPATIVSGAGLTLSASRSSDTGGTVKEYRFTVDGVLRATDSPSLTIPGLAIGAHSASLVVVDDSGNVSAPVAATITVLGRPTAVLDAPARLSVTAAGLVLSASRSVVAGERLVEYRWTIDGSTLVTADPSLTRPVPSIGRHTVALTVVDAAGTESAPVAADVIVVDDQRPTAVLDAPVSVAAGAKIPLVGSRSTDVGGRVKEYRWRLGSRAVVATADPTFSAPGFSSGPVTATLTVVDDSGNESAPVAVKIGILPAEKVVATFPSSLSLIAPVGKRDAQLSRTSRRLLAGRIFSPEAIKLTATFSLRRGGRTIALGKRTITVEERGVVRLEVKLTAGVVRQLRGLRTAKVRMRSSVRKPGARRPEVSTRTITVRIS